MSTATDTLMSEASGFFTQLREVMVLADEQRCFMENAKEAAEAAAKP